VEYLDPIFNWFRDHAGLTGGLLLFSLFLLVGSIWLGHYYLTRIPHDYFVRSHIPFERLRARRPVLWWMLMIGKNALGTLLILAGLIMFITPGQGLLTLVMGLALTNFPGKQRLERAILNQPVVRKTVNRMRARANRPPLVLHPTN
jgi:hypothetical protein